VELVDEAGNYLQQLRPQMGGLGAQGSKSSMDPALASQEVGYNLRGSRSFSPVTGWWFRTFGLFFHSVGNGIIIPTDFHSIIFQRGRLLYHQTGKLKWPFGGLAIPCLQKKSHCYWLYPLIVG